MNFYELEVFDALAKTLHFGKTASKMNLSASALSRIISRLEDECGTPLVDRSNRKVLLTPQGQEFERFAQESLARKEELQFQFSKRHERIEGVLPLFASVTACYTILPGFIKKLSEKYPGIHLSVETGDPALAIPAVREGRALLAVGAIPENGLAGMETVSVIQTPLVYAAAKKGPFTSVEGSAQEIVSKTPLVLPKTGLARTRFDRWTKECKIQPNIAAETEGNEAILAIAQLGLGIGLVPQIVLENGPYKGEFIIHAAENLLGFYDVGFIRKAEIAGTTSSRLIQEAVKEILDEYSARTDGQK